MLIDNSWGKMVGAFFQMRIVFATGPLLTGCTAMPPSEFIPPEPIMQEAPVSEVNLTGSIYQAGAERPLFEDRTARRIGDVITVILAERTNASKTASTKASKSQETEISSPRIFGQEVTYNNVPILSASAAADRDFSGQGESAQSNQIQGNITVQVVGRARNGNLMIKGEKWITLNQGQELVRITGIVRPTDIGPDNTVISTKVADSRITYSGRGALADANNMGWAARLFNSPLWPF